MALFWHNHFATAYSKVAGAFGAVHAHEDDGRASRPDLAGACAGRSQLFRDIGARQLPRSAGRSGEGPGDAGVARRPHQRPRRGRRRTSAASSWSCSRSASATTSRPTSTPRRVSSPAGTCELAGDRGNDGRPATTQFVYNQASTTRRRRTSRSRSIPTAAGRSRRARRPQAMQDGLDLIAALARASGDGPPPGDAALRVLRQRGRRRPTSRSSTTMANAYLGSDYSIKAMLRALFAVGAVPRRGEHVPRTTPGRWSSSCGRSRKPAGRASRWIAR